MVEKGYQGRGVAVGRLDGNAFVAYVLASRSDSERSVRAVPEKNRIEIYAVGGAVDRIRAAAEYPYDGAHNLYSPIIGFMDTWKRPAAVAFNGRMSSRIKDRMERRSDHASDCLRTTLQDFVPAVKNDSRIGAVVDFNSSGGPRFNLGIFGVDDALPLVSELEDVEENQVVYVTLGDDPRDYTKMHLAEVASVGNAADLAEQLFYEMLGDKPVAALGSGVCLIKDGEFNFGVFTP